MPGNTSKFKIYQLGLVFHNFNLSTLRFIVRDFTYNEEELAAGKNEITKLATDKKKQFVRIHELNIREMISKVIIFVN